MTSPNIVVAAAAAAASRTRRSGFKPRPAAVSVPAEAKSKKVSGKKSALTKHKLKLQTTSAGSKTGTRPLASNTKLHYKKQLDQLESFLTLIGDYDSLLLLDEKAPTNCISMNVESLALYIQFKRTPKDTPLKNLADEEVHDVSGNPIKCQGSWKNPKIVDHLTAAVKLLHQARHHESSYQEACPDCLELPADDQHKGCSMHAGLPRLKRQGNPCNSIIYTDTVAQLRKDGKAYQPQGSNFLSPKDLRHLQQYLCNSGSLRDLQSYVMLLLGVKLFLRHDEYSNIQMKHFEEVQKRYVIDENGIHGLCLEVTGKCDNIPQQLLTKVGQECT